MKHAGIHWPENAGGEHPNVDTILAMPGISHGCTLICAPSARYWYRQARGASPLVVWRAIPRQGKLPAQLGWDARKVAEECLNLWDEQPHSGIEFFTPLNELQFDKENGAPFPGYGPMAQNLARLRPALRQEFEKRGQHVRLIWPAWVPSDDMDHLLDWHHEAVNWDAIGLHCYGGAETMRTRYDSYRAAFPDHGIFVGEWNANHEGHDEHAALEMWAEVADTDPGFMGATYYIWETNNAGERDLSIWGNPDRLALFANPPTVAEPEEPETVYRVPTWTPQYEHIRDGAIQVADEYGMPRRRLLGLCLAESGFQLQSFDRWASIERSARMTAAINQSDWPRVEAIFSEISGKTDDISFGPCHQSWWWSLTYTEQLTYPEWRWDLSKIMDFRAHLIEDHGTALRLAAGKIAGGGDDIDVLCLYNKPNTPPAANPNRPNYERSLAEADRVLAGLFPQPKPSGGIVYEDYTDPQPAGTFASMPRGIILHGSRSGKAGNPQEQEYKGTASYEVNNTAGLGWHATIADHRVAVHLDPRSWGWHALQASRVYLGVELAQPTVNDPITDAQVDAVADWITTRVLPAWPALPMHFPSHPEADQEFGVNQGKSDAFPLGDPRMDDLRARLMTRLKSSESEEPMNEYSVGPGILQAMADHNDSPATDEQYHGETYSEAFGQSGARYTYIASLNRTFRYDPAA